jgi:GxxExxY protein
MLRRDDLLYPDLSFKIVGVLIEVYKQLGPGHQERYYQKAVALGLTKAGLQFEEQKYIIANFTLNGVIYKRVISNSQK